MKCQATWMFVLKVLSFLHTTGIPFGFLWCFDILKLLSGLQCCRSVTDRCELISTVCTGIVVVPAVTFFRKIYKPLHSRRDCCYVSLHLSPFVTLEVWKMCAMCEWMRTLLTASCSALGTPGVRNRRWIVGLVLLTACLFRQWPWLGLEDWR